MTQREVASFCRQLSHIAGAGMNFDAGILLVAESGKEASIQKKRMVRRLQSGEDFVEVLRKERLFEEELLGMIEIALETGCLEETFNELAEYYEREATIKENIKAAFYYPLILGSMLLVVMCLLFIQVRPIFKQIYQELGIAATGLTRVFFDLGGILGILIIMILAALWFIIFAGNFWTSLKKVQKIWLHIMKNGQYVELVDMIHLTSVMGFLVHNGQQIDEALDRGEGITHLSQTKKQLRQCREEYLRTPDLMKAFEKSGLFHPYVRKNLALALRTGHLEEGLKEASLYYERILEKFMTKRMTIIEPASIGIISVMIGSILLSVMFPLMNLVNTLS